MYSTIMTPTVETVETVYHVGMTERTNTTETANTPMSANGRTFGRSKDTERLAIERLRAKLANVLARSRVRDDHQLATREHKAEHEIALADLAERVANAKRSRRERYRDARDAVSLADLYRRATESGTRAYIRAQIQGSAEMRALRVASVHKVTMLVGIPVLLAFAAWSTSGVQDGVVRVLNLTSGSFAWVASWGVEPAIITIVAMIIIGRAVLRSSGGGTDWRATCIEWTAIGLSLALNIIGGWPIGTSWSDWRGIVTALPHAIGPIGCATTAYLIGLFDEYVTRAKPWKDAPRLDDLNLVIARPNTSNTLAEANTTTSNTERETKQLANEQPAIARASTPNASTDTNTTTTSNERTDHEHLANELTANTDPSEHHVFVRPMLDDLVRPVRARRTPNDVRANGVQDSIDPKLIERLDNERPGWRTNFPSARELAAVLGYSSSSTGNKIRRLLLVYVQQNED